MCDERCCCFCDFLFVLTGWLPFSFWSSLTACTTDCFGVFGPDVRMLHEIVIAPSKWALLNYNSTLKWARLTRETLE